jgi:hypothetical protein
VAEQDIEARQRARNCNQDNEPHDWGRPCCVLCICAAEAEGRESLLDELDEIDPDWLREDRDERQQLEKEDGYNGE